jgi:uncharacterized membrane protein YczE
MREKIGRVLMAVIGVLIGGVSVGLFKMSVFGTDPFQCLMNGLNNWIPISFGIIYVIVNSIMLVGIFFLEKRYIGIATAINVFLFGYVVEYAESFFRILTPTPNMGLRIGYLTVGLLILCLASAFYFTADMGVSTYDAIALIISNRTKWKFKYCRIGTDLICVLIGFSLHAVIGIGTLLTAFFMGPIIAFFEKYVSEPFLIHVVQEKNKKRE